MISKIERETVILYNEAQETAEVYTHNKALQRKLAHLTITRPNEVRIVPKDNALGGQTYVVPKSFIKVTVLPKLIDEQRQNKREAIEFGIRQRPEQ